MSKSAANKPIRRTAAKTSSKPRPATKAVVAPPPYLVAAMRKIVGRSAARESISFPGQLQLWSARGPRLVSLPHAAPLPSGTRFAAVLEPAEVRAHLYVAMKDLHSRLVVPIAYASKAVFAGEARRLPQPGAWLTCPVAGMVVLVASDAPLDGERLAELLGGLTSLPGH